MKRLSVVFGVSLFFFSLLMPFPASQAQADDSLDSPAILRHRVGHRAKVQDLDVRLAQGDGGDPLAGNYRLVSDDEVFLAMRDSYGTITKWRAYDVDADLDALSWINETNVAGSKPAVATGNFVNDALGDFVLIYADEERSIHMDVGYLRNGLYTNEASFDTGETVYSNYPPRVAAGDFDGDGLDEIVMAWLGGGGWVNIKVYEPNGTIHPTATDDNKIYDEKIANGNLDVATGDFDGDGDDEIVLAWEDLGNYAAVKLYDVDQNGVPTEKAKWKGDGGRTLAVAAGDLNGNGSDEITVADGESLRIFQIGDDLDSLNRKGKTGWTCANINESPIPVDIATGDFDTDGLDEIVTSCFNRNLQVHVWASDSDLKLHHRADWEKSVETGQAIYTGSLAVGDANRDLRSEIVVTWALWEDQDASSSQHNHIQVLEVSTDLSTIGGKSQLDLGEVPLRSYVAVSLGDLDGDSLRVGPPTYSQITSVKQLIAVVNEPPKHYDVLGGSTYDVNYNEKSYASYEDSHQQSTEMSLTTTRDWGISTGLEAEYEGISASLKTSYGENFEDTTSTFKEKSFGQNVWAASDDTIIRTETDFDVWEYPVYTNITGTLQGHIAVVFPRKRDPNCTSNCETSVLAHVNGKNAQSYYVPDHENGNALSYSTAGPDDIGEVIKDDSLNYLGSNPYEFWVEWSDVESDESKKSRQLDVAIGAGVEHWGIKVDVEGTYGQGEISTQKTSFENSTSIHVYFDGINELYSYKAEPYIYWSSEGGHLVVDYAAAPATSDPTMPPTWWEETYDKPDPTFNLPWKYNSPKNDYNELSKEIRFDPPSPEAGDRVTITAKVRNYSLVGADNVKVRFYRGDPDDGGVQIGAEQNIPQLNPLSSHPVEVHFDTTGFGSSSFNIFVVVDPDNHIDEMHEDYNRAYAILPVKPSGAPVTRPVNLSITLEDIHFDPDRPSMGDTVRISATVHARGDTFTHVATEFWDGDPSSEGRNLGSAAIPMIVAGESTDVGFDWQTSGAQGPHEIWVGIDFQSGKEELPGDNWAHRTINLLPHHLYVPLAEGE